MKTLNGWLSDDLNHSIVVRFKPHERLPKTGYSSEKCTRFLTKAEFQRVITAF